MRHLLSNERCPINQPDFGGYPAEAVPCTCEQATEVLQPTLSESAGNTPPDRGASVLFPVDTVLVEVSSGIHPSSTKEYTRRTTMHEQDRQRRLQLRELAEAANQPWSKRRQEFYATVEPDCVLTLIAKADLADLLRERIVRAIAASEDRPASDAVQVMLDILQDTEGHGLDHD